MASPSSSYLYRCIILLSFLLLTTRILAQTHHNISLGTTLTPLIQPNAWLSPSEDFAFGFHPLETDSSLFLLAIWYNRIANKTVVWTANGNKPLKRGSKVELTSDGQLSLKDQTGQEIWNPGITKASYAAMLDTGNLVLSTADSTIMWQSFDYPTDTILPGQIVNMGTSLYARLMDNDYSRGRFMMTMEYNGSLMLRPIAYPTTFQYPSYWDSGTFEIGVRLVYNQSGNIYVTLVPSSAPYKGLIVAAITEDNYQRATLDSDGVFRQYTFPKNAPDTGSWVVKNSLIENICGAVMQVGSGPCGFNSYCTLDVDGRAACQCPPYFSFFDPTRKYKGCKPDFVFQSCEPGGETLFDFAETPNADWSLSDAEQLNPMNETQCKDNCLKDCLCLVAVYKSGTCWKKKFPLSNGNLGSGIDREVFIKFPKYNSTTSQSLGSDDWKRNWKAWVMAVSVFLATVSVVLNIVQVTASLYTRKGRLSFKGSPGSCPSLHSFTYRELEQATRGFREELGRGAFGIVYKGVIADSESETLVAVKKLEGLLEKAEKDFDNEVNTISQTHHRNLVRLLGFCKEGTQRLLIYEYLSNGSLNKCIFGTNRPKWIEREQIAIAIAQGLAYLHEECRTQIIHCDIKPQNILLDDSYDPKISDFGLAKLLGIEQTRTRTGVRGTIGYFAPEWFKNVAITTKVDVYSFGVMLLEIICCRRNFVLGLDNMERASLVDWAKECYRNGKLDCVVEDDEEAKNDGTGLERFVMVGILCTQDDPSLRPSMKTVARMLEGAIEVSMPSNMYSIYS